MIIAFILAFLTLTGLVTFHIVVFMSLMLGLVDAFELPCRYSLVSYMVDRKEDVSNGVALNSMNFNIREPHHLACNACAVKLAISDLVFHIRHREPYRDVPVF